MEAKDIFNYIKEHVRVVVEGETYITVKLVARNPETGEDIVISESTS